MGTAVAVAEMPAEAATPLAKLDKPRKSPRRNKGVAEPAIAAAESESVETGPVGGESVNLSESTLEPVVVPVAPSVAAVDRAALSSDIPTALAEVEPPPFDPTPVNQTHRQSSRPLPEVEPDRPRFRSWTVRSTSGYEKLTDTKRGLLVLKFHDRPTQDILNAVKDGGFLYHPDYEGQGKVWLRKNDFEGRVQVDKIEAFCGSRNKGRDLRGSRVTKLYDRRQHQVTRNIVDRISV